MAAAIPVALVFNTLVEFLKLLSYAARSGPPHCGTPCVTLLLLMLFFTAMSIPVWLWNLHVYRRNSAVLTARFRFLARFPFVIFAALELSYWGIMAYTSLP